MEVYVIMTGDGSDGSPYDVHRNFAFSTEERAREYIAAHNAHRPTWAHLSYDDVCGLLVDVPFDPKDFPYDKPKGT